LHPPPTLNLLSFCLLLFSSLTVRGPKAPHYALNYSPRQTFCPTIFPCANLLENRRIIQSMCRMVTRFYLLSFFCLVGSSSDSVVWLHDSVFSLFSALLHPPPTLNLLSFCLLLFSSLTVRGPKAPHYALNYSPRQTFCPITFPCANLLENRRIIQSIAVLDSCIMI